MLQSDACKLIGMGAITDEGGVISMSNHRHLSVYIDRLRDSLVDACKLIGMGAITEKRGVISMRNRRHLSMYFDRL